MNINKTISIISGKNIEWKRVDDLPCVHMFTDRYYINLCFYNNQGIRTIAIDVDDYIENDNDIINTDIPENAEFFDELNNVYQYAIKNSTQVIA